MPARLVIGDLHADFGFEGLADRTRATDSPEAALTEALSQLIDYPRDRTSDTRPWHISKHAFPRRKVSRGSQKPDYGPDRGHGASPRRHGTKPAAAAKCVSRLRTILPSSVRWASPVMRALRRADDSDSLPGRWAASGRSLSSVLLM
jgi:hypothetical protein